MFTTSKPATFPISTLLEALSARIAAWRGRRAYKAAAREARRAFATTLHLDDRMLADMGVTRAEVEWAHNLPLDACASTALFDRVAARRAAKRRAGRSPFAE